MSIAAAPGRGSSDQRDSACPRHRLLERLQPLGQAVVIDQSQPRDVAARVREALRVSFAHGITESGEYDGVLRRPDEAGNAATLNETITSTGMRSRSATSAGYALVSLPRRDTRW